MQSKTELEMGPLPTTTQVIDSFVAGEASREETMQHLHMDSCPELLNAVADRGIEPPGPSRTQVDAALSAAMPILWMMAAVLAGIARLERDLISEHVMSDPARRGIMLEPVRRHGCSPAMRCEAGRRVRSGGAGGRFRARHASACPGGGMSGKRLLPSGRVPSHDDAGKVGWAE